MQHKYNIGSFRCPLKPAMLVVVDVTEVNAMQWYPELARLVELTRTGWRFRPVVEDGEPVCIVGWSNRRATMDVLWIYDRFDCWTARLLADMPGARGGLVWEYSGALASCVAELVALPAPSAPALVVARAPALWMP